MLILTQPAFAILDLMRLLKENFAYYKLHDYEHTEQVRNVLLGHLLQIAELMEEKRVEDVFALDKCGKAERRHNR